MTDLFGRTLADHVDEAREILDRAIDAFDPVRTFALCSGGNDSMTLLHIVRDQVDAVVHIDTGIGIPETNAFVREEVPKLGLELIELTTPPTEYRNIVLGLNKDGERTTTNAGFPGPAAHRYAYHRLKSRRLQELQRDHSRPGEVLLLVTGVRSFESRRRMSGVAGHEMEAPNGPHKTRLTRCAWANPIVHFDSLMMNAYREAHDVARNPVADLLHMSGECCCGAFSHPGELEEIDLWFPEMAARIHALEAEARAAGLAHCTWGWGSTKRGTPPPGPLCSSCSLFEEPAEVAT